MVEDDGDRGSSKRSTTFAARERIEGSKVVGVDIQWPPEVTDEFVIYDIFMI